MQLKLNKILIIIKNRIKSKNTQIWDTRHCFSKRYNRHWEKTKKRATRINKALAVHARKYSSKAFYYLVFVKSLQRPK